MLHIHKPSATPIDPWPTLRHGGLNNLDAGIRAKYLLLWNFDVVRREGKWHYIFEFDTRDSLETRGLAQLVGQPPRYPDDIDWKHWLGDDYTVITAGVREAILNMPAHEAHTEAIITDLRELPFGPPLSLPSSNSNRPLPQRDAALALELTPPSSRNRPSPTLYLVGPAAVS